MSIGADYRLWMKGESYGDLVSYINDVLELNRDVLEGLVIAEGESNDLVRGRSRALRDLLNYIKIASEQNSEEETFNES